MSKSIMIDGVKYVPESPVDPSEMVIVRCAQAGVHYGKLEGRVKDEVRLSRARRLWYWDGAASLSEMALCGVKKPAQCKFSARLPEITILGAIEIIPCSALAVTSIEEVDEWLV